MTRRAVEILKTAQQALAANQQLRVAYFVKQMNTYKLTIQQFFGKLKILKKHWYRNILDKAYAPTNYSIERKDWIMYITFLVGNGFDIASGLDTSYAAFYNWYCNQPNTSPSVGELKKI